MMTVRGVFSSWEASATNCRCCCHAVSTGFTAHRASSQLMSRNTAKHSAPIRRQVSMRLDSVACSLDMSAKAMRSPWGVTLRQYRRP